MLGAMKTALITLLVGLASTASPYPDYEYIDYGHGRSEAQTIIIPKGSYPDCSLDCWEISGGRRKCRAVCERREGNLVCNEVIGSGEASCISNSGTVEAPHPERVHPQEHPEEEPSPIVSFLGSLLGGQPSLVEEVAEGTCTTTCNNWPHGQCKVELQWGNGGHQSATCINPYSGSSNRFNNQPQKFSNYPKCASIPSGCKRCDETCAVREGRRSR